MDKIKNALNILGEVAEHLLGFILVTLDSFIRGKPRTAAIAFSIIAYILGVLS